MLHAERRQLRAVVFSLMSMDLSSSGPSLPTPRSKGQLRDGFRYVAHTPELGIPLLMMGLVGMLAYEFQVTLPVRREARLPRRLADVRADDVRHGHRGHRTGPDHAAASAAGMRPMVSRHSASGWSLPRRRRADLPLELVALGAVGFASVTFLAMGNRRCSSRPIRRCAAG